MTTNESRTFEHELRTTVAAVCNKIAPVWPLRDYVAVNPFLGFAHSSPIRAAQELSVTSGGRLAMPRDFYRKAMDSGLLDGTALVEAAMWWRARDATASDAAELEQAARSTTPTAPSPRLPTVVDDLEGLPVDGEWVTDYISGWAGAYFDASLSTWPSPWKDLEPWAAFKAEAELDATPRAHGVGFFSDLMRSLPASSIDVIAMGLEALAVTTNGREAYLQRLATSIGGWCAYARQRDFHAATEPERSRTFCDLLAIRLVWDWALLLEVTAEGRERWALLVRRFYDGRVPLEVARGHHEVGIDVSLHHAYEIARQRELVALFNRPRAEPAPAQAPRVQAVFCIDVRSEIYRRALEHVAPHVQTHGFAGFFGFPIEVAGPEGPSAQCPVLLEPSIGVASAHHDDDSGFASVWSAAKRGVAAMKGSAVGSFTFVETLGAAYVPKLLRRVAGAATPRRDTAVGLELQSLSGARGDVALDDEPLVAAAYNALRAMSLGELAPLVVLVGHEAVSENNAHASGLHCGACGGHSGASNARFAAMVLNDERVRARLALRGMVIPDGTWFVAAVHRTTTDEVMTFDTSAVPESLRGELARLSASFAEAGRRARTERERTRSGASNHAEWFRRSRDWSEPRPELGLAGCHAFVVAPRAMTRDLDFGGRAFLHSYDWQADAEFRVLEAIMTAPMVVTNWINLQYFASTVDPEHFGCGNKALHNIVGNIGVVEGRGGDLRVGLSLQSLFDGERMFHDPVRLNVFVAAPTDAITNVLSKHREIRALADNGWLHLWALDDRGRVAARYRGGLRWGAVAAPNRDAQEAA